MTRGKKTVATDHPEMDLLVGSVTRPPDFSGAVADDEVEAIYQEFSSVEAEVVRELAAQGLDVEERFQAGRPKTPYPQVDIERLDQEGSAGYNRVYTELLSWLGYVTTLLARSQNDLLSSKNALEQVSAKIRNSLSKEGAKAEALDHRMRVNPVFIKALKAWQKAKEREVLIESYRANLERDLRAVSRSVTIRGQDLLLNPEGRRITQPEPSTPTPSVRPKSPYRGLL